MLLRRRFLRPLRMCYIRGIVWCDGNQQKGGMYDIPQPTELSSSISCIYTSGFCGYCTTYSYYQWVYLTFMSLEVTALKILF
jgi:hypothetical protein